MKRLRAWWRKRREVARLYDEYETVRLVLIVAVNSGISGPPRDRILSETIKAFDAIVARKARP